MEHLPLGQLLTMGLPGPELDAEARDFIRRAQPGGFILFARNLESPSQVRALCDQLRSLCDVPPILTIDQEGGRVSRLRKIGQQPPSADQLRRANNDAWIQEHGHLTAELLRLFGFNLNLAPVVDILLDESRDNSLTGRCYGVTPEEVVRRAGLFLGAMQEGGVAGTIKHFPGYSMCGKDPHGALPRVDRTRAELEAVELVPFRAMMPHASAVMVGHAHYPALDPSGDPSSLSRIITHQLLREELGYGGLTVTDDLEMGAISYEFGVAEATRRALRAGNDLLLFCHQRECVEIALETLSRMGREELERPLHKVRCFKKRLASPLPWSAEQCREVNRRIGELRERVESAICA
jgi:beta-N-acetylhexosaminidase